MPTALTTDLPASAHSRPRGASHRPGRHGRGRLRAPPRRQRGAAKARSARSPPSTCAATTPTSWQPPAKSRDKAAIDRANLGRARPRDPRGALRLADGKGIVAVNIMRAVSEYAAYVRQACESGIQAIVVGAGLPLDLPDLTSDHPDVALIPILSDARGIGVVLKKWMRKNRLPDAIVIEHPALRRRPPRRGEDRGPAATRASSSRPCSRARSGSSRSWASQREKIPLIVAGGIEHAGARARAPRPGRVRRAARHRVRGDRGGRRAPRLQEGARRGEAGGHRGVHERGGPARARREDAVARELPRRSSRRCSGAPSRARRARSRSTACNRAGCATASRAPASSASTCSWPPRSRATSSTGSSSAAPGGCPSASASGRCASSSPTSSRSPAAAACPRARPLSRKRERGAFFAPLSLSTAPLPCTLPTWQVGGGQITERRRAAPPSSAPALPGRRGR